MPEPGFNGPSDLDQKLDEAFGPMPDEEARLRGEVEQLRLLLAQAHTDARVQQSGGWAAPPDLLDLPKVDIQRGGVLFPTRREPAAGPMIWTLLSNAMNEVTAVGKTGFNEQQKYNFRGIDAVINALGPALRRHGVIPVPKLRKITYRDTLSTAKQEPTREVTVEVRYRFYAPDGSYAEVVVPGESLDRSDKGAAKAMSVAYRIALIQLFCLPTDEPDPDASYNTRAGMGAMAATVATMMGKLMPTSTVYDLLMWWPIIEEHSAADKPWCGSPNDTRSWLQVFAERYAALIEQIETIEEGRAFVDAMIVGSPAWSVGDTTLKHLTLARGKFVKERQEKTFDHCMEQIVAAEDTEALGVARGCADAALEAKVLTAEQVEQLDVVARERWTKVRNGKTPFAPTAEEVAELDATIDAAVAAVGFLATEGEQWNRFVTLADAPNLTVSELLELLDGVEGVVLPAVSWGDAGLQRVADAVARSHKRDHSIENADRAWVQQRLVEAAVEAGLDEKLYRVWSE